MDYCTLWLEGWWSTCCKAHDAAYDAQVLREVADQALLQCVATSLPEFAVNHPFWASIFGGASVVIGGGMYLVVRLFGGRFYRRAGEQGK